MIDIDWIKAQGAPSWAQHMANEIFELQGGTYEPPSGSTPAAAATVTPPESTPETVAIDADGDTAVPGKTGTAIDGLLKDK